MHAWLYHVPYMSIKQGRVSLYRNLLQLRHCKDSRLCGYDTNNKTLYDLLRQIFFTITWHYVVVFFLVQLSIREWNKYNFITMCGDTKLDTHVARYFRLSAFWTCISFRRRRIAKKYSTISTIIFLKYSNKYHHFITIIAKFSASFFWRKETFFLSLLYALPVHVKSLMFVSENGPLWVYTSSLLIDWLEKSFVHTLGGIRKEK